MFRATVVVSFSSFQTGLQLPLTCSNPPTTTTQVRTTTQIQTTTSTPAPLTPPQTLPPTTPSPRSTRLTRPAVIATETTQTAPNTTISPFEGCQFAALNNIPEGELK